MGNTLTAMEYFADGVPVGIMLDVIIDFYTHAV